MKYNLLIDTDSYKYSHIYQFPPNTTNMFYYLESRGGRYRQTLFFGLQYILKEYLTTQVTKEMVDEAEDFATNHGLPFAREAWMYIVEKHNGYLPVKIKAVKEGTIVPVSNVLMTVESTDPKCFWVPSFIETVLMRVWYPITVATQSWHIKQIIKSYLEKTSDDGAVKSELPWKLHDFGSRGVSSSESAGIGGASHLVNFMGSDTVVGVRYANFYYHCKMAGFSIPAAEHSTVISWGKSHEVDAYRNMLQFAKPGSLVAIVSDSYDLEYAVEYLWGEQLHDEVVNSGATIVIRPDSGHPPTIVLKTLQLLDSKFGSSYNTKGYKVLNSVRVIQGDGINEESIREILELATKAGFSASNIAFGMGGALLQQVNRDTQKFAFKCSEVTVDGVRKAVSKNPITDPSKASKKGRLDLVRNFGKFETVQDNGFGSMLELVYENGKLMKDYNLKEIRDLSSEF